MTHPDLSLATLSAARRTCTLLFGRAAGLMGIVAIVAVAGAIAGCTGTMPSPVGMTAARHGVCGLQRRRALLRRHRARPRAAGAHRRRARLHAFVERGRLRPSLPAHGLGRGAGARGEHAASRPAHRLRSHNPDAGFRFRAQPPAGVERLLFLATRQPFAGFGGGAAAAGPVQVAVDAHAFVSRLNEATGRLPERSWALAETRIEIVDAGG